MSNPTHEPLIFELDLAILGGGIAGLWLLNRARQAGYHCALFDAHGLGSGQTLAAQGMIHGGMKYTLGGALNRASETIADMPGYWRACLNGTGELDLRQTKLLCDHFFLWSSATVSSRLTTFLASKLIRGRVESVAAEQRPELLNHPDFTGSLYRINDLVIDLPSLLRNLIQHVQKQLFALNWQHAQLQLDPQGRVELQLKEQGKTIIIRARRFIFCAGQGNGDLMAKLGIESPSMQLRPLQQVMVKHYSTERFYGHCLGTDSTPRLTISSHPTSDGGQVWYLGGSLAEQGATQSNAEVIAKAQHELATLLPWLTLKNATWASLRVDRAEPRQANLARPDNAFAARAQGASNLVVAWPTKLTLAPNLTHQVLRLLEEDQILATPSDPSALSLLRNYLPEPHLAATPWATVFEQESTHASDHHEA